MYICEVSDDNIWTLKVDVFFPRDGRVCFRSSSLTFFGLEGSGEVSGVYGLGLWFGGGCEGR